MLCSLARRGEIPARIIFMDDLASTGWTGESLREGGKNEKHWTEVETSHLNRIKEVMKLSEIQ